MTVHPANLKNTFMSRLPKLKLETAVALAGTAFAALLLVLTAMYAGPLWRDEINTLSVAQMPSLKELWDNMAFESFPPLWPLLVRGCSFLGLAGSDASIRVLGLYVGLFFLVSLWLCSRWLGGRAPILSVALLGCLPAFVFIVGANRAYGLATCLLVLSFGLIWRMVEFPSRSRILLAGLVCFLFAHCVYYDVVFLCAMLSGGALVVIRRRQWKTLMALAVIGSVSAASMAIYLPIIHQGSAYVPMNQPPFFSASMLWFKVSQAVSTHSSASFGKSRGTEIWLWIGLFLAGSIAALIMQRARVHTSHGPETATVTAVQIRADRALFCVVTMLFGVFGFFAFLLKLHYLTQTWYYVEILCLCAISLDGLLGANWPKLRPWGLLRISFLLLVMTWGARSAWEEAHTRRSDVDLIAAVLNKAASEQDIIVVEGAWEGITFNRYYHGHTRWMTVPPVDSHLVHRNDLAFARMNQPEPMVPVLQAITNTLHSGHNVWLVGMVGSKSAVHLDPPLSGRPIEWFVAYSTYWNAQIAAVLLDHTRQAEVLKIPIDGPVFSLEDLPLTRFSGYKPGVY
ncbi:MAG TPA: hypothetical protein VHY30_00695 [Verrucomicrobiae bacterium]|nr:hypothetical protein [Verrucomicrobiae bacterium]